MTKIVEKPADLLGMVGTTLGPTSWVAIEQDRAHAAAYRLAYRDALTQLANRTAFF